MNDDAAWMRPDADLGAYVSSPEPPTPTPRRRRGAIAAIAAGSAVALVAGVLALATLNDDGKGTPEAAVQKLFDAMAAEDAIGAIAALVPAERQVLGSRLVDIAGELGRLGILSDDLELSRISGADLAFDGLTLKSEALTEDVASVLITGDRMRLGVTSADLPLGPFTRALVDKEGPLDSPEPVEPVEVRLAAVRENGNWYVSLGHSLADFFRREAGLGVPDYSTPVVPRGESSPEAAVRELARAAADLDVRRLVELAPPGEGAALHDHAPLFLGFAERYAEAVKADGLRITVDPLKVTVDESGDDARVTITEAVATIDSDGETSTFGYDGRCLRIADEDDDDGSVLCADDPELEGLAGRGFGPLGISVVREGGSWYVSPVRSWLDGILETLRGTDRSDMETAVDEGGEVAAFSPFFSPLPFEVLFFLGRAAQSSESIETGVGAPCTQDLATGELICLEPAPPIRPPEIMASTIPTQPLPSPTTVP